MISPYQIAVLDGLAARAQHRSEVRVTTLAALESEGLISGNERGFVWPSRIGRTVLDAHRWGLKQGRGERKECA